MLTGAAKDCAQFVPAGMASDPYAWPGRAIRRDGSAHDGSAHDGSAHDRRDPGVAAD
jgi:hypothetical protein